MTSTPCRLFRDMLGFESRLGSNAVRLKKVTLASFYFHTVTDGGNQNRVKKIGGRLVIPFGEKKKWFAKK